MKISELINRLKGYSVFAIVLLVCLIFIGPYGCSMALPLKDSAGTKTPTLFSPTQTSQPTMTPIPDRVPVSFKLNFDSKTDLGWLYLRPFRMSFRNLEPEERYLVNGALRIGGDTKLRRMEFVADLTPDMILHVRLRQSKDGFCSYVRISPSTIPKSVGIEGCPNEIYRPWVVYNLSRIEERGELPYTGEVTVNADDWIDLVIWLTPDLERVYYFVGRVNNPNDFSFGGVSLPEDWIAKRWRLAIGGKFDADIQTNYPALQYQDIDFIYLTQGPIKNYLYHSFPGYVQYEDEIDQLLMANPKIITDVSLTKIYK